MNTERYIIKLSTIDSEKEVGFKGTTVIKQVIESEYTGEVPGKKWRRYHGSCYVSQDPEYWDTTETYETFEEADKALEEMAKDLYNKYERVTYNR